MIHRLEFLKQKNTQGFILRDDLLGLPFSGSKHRKYQGLFSFLKKTNPSCLIIPGSIASNHFLLSIDYALKQQIPVIAVTKKTYGPLRPNAQKALELLQHSEVIFDLDPFQRAENIHKTTSNSFLMPLGGFHQEAAKTSLSLGYEIGDFHKQTPLKRVFLDAGTGLQAACALLALQEIGFQGEAYIVMMGPLDFYKVMQQVSEWVELPLPSFKIHPVYPLTARSYGKTNKTLQDFRKEFFEKEKIVLDDVYNAKLFHTALSYIRDLKLEGPYLIVHSGGTYSGTISE